MCITHRAAQSSVNKRQGTCGRCERQAMSSDRSKSFCQATRMAALLSGESRGFCCRDVTVAIGDIIPSRWTDAQWLSELAALPGAWV